MTSGTDKTTFSIDISGNGLSVQKEIDSETAMRVIGLVIGDQAPADETLTADPDPAPKKVSPQKPRAKKTKGPSKGRKRRKSSPGIVKDLSTRPKGKKALTDFASEKAPGTHQEKQLIAVYWLQKIAGVSGITVDHVNTCYQAAGWPRPKDLDNALAVTAMRKGWLDTSEMSDIRLTAAGEDVVDHDLPKKKD